MIWLGESENRYTSDGSGPPIVIEDGVDIKPEQVLRLYTQAQYALNRIFNRPLMSGSVKEILISNTTEADKEEPNLLGEFTATKVIKLYPNRINPKTGRNWGEVLKHEFGHAYHAQFSALLPMPDVYCEAVAEMFVPIISAEGDIKKISTCLRRSFHRSNRLLFGPMTRLSAYPLLLEKQQDSAQLFYMACVYGFDAVYNLAKNPPLVSVKHQGIFFSNSTEFLTPEFCRYQARLLDANLKGCIGITRAQLYEDSRAWYNSLSTLGYLRLFKTRTFSRYPFLVG